jgi:hypothetical protein
VRPFALRLEQRAPRLVRNLQLLESLVFIMNTVAGILGASLALDLSASGLPAHCLLAAD